MLTSFRLNKHEGQQRRQITKKKPLLAVEVVSVLSGTVELLSPLLLLSSGLLTIVIIIISGVHSSNLIDPFKQQQQQTPLILIQPQQGSSLPNNNDNQHLIDSTTATTTSSSSSRQLRQATNNHKAQRQQRLNNLFKLHQRGGQHSSSSANLIEDLNDSSIRTRFGIVDRDELPEQLEFKPTADFEQLIERLLRPLASAAQKGAEFPPGNQIQPGQLQPLMVAADPNNKTTMRFFRNNKTFASIVYTNEQPENLRPNLSFHSNTNEAASNTTAGSSGSKKRKLINCHLVDLEKHSSDVDVFESKYKIKTIDIEFREMMQLIDACTDIARFRSAKPPPPPPASGSPGQHQPNPVQLFAAALPKTSISSSSSSSLSSSSQQQQQQKVMSQQLSNLAPPLSSQQQQLDAASGKLLQLPSGAPLPPPANNRKRHMIVQAPPPRDIVNKALSRLGQTSKRLVLGEVTPLPGLVEARGGSIKEALQEITSYDTTDLLAFWRGILPGTNWCGMGDRATSYNDLGFESDIDICCRAHDFCPIRLSAFSSGYGLFNWSFYTRSHCWCDQNFLDCLQRAQSPLSAVVMKFYFTIMKTTCLHDNETIGADPSFYSTAAATAARQKLTPASISWWSLGGSGTAAKNGGTGKSKWSLSGNSKQQQQPQKQAAVPPAAQQQSSSSSPSNTEQEHKQLLEQIRAKMPIPALKLSQAFSSKLDSRTRPVSSSTARLRAGFK